MVWKFPHKNRSGQLIVELLIVFGVLGLMLPALLTGMITTRQSRPQQERRLSATALMNEAQEAVRAVRNQDWTTFAVNGIYHPEIVNNNWKLMTGTETIDGIRRTITISDVHRASNGIIVASGGVNDPSTKKITTLIEWDTPYPSSAGSTMYLTRYMDNLVYHQTTEAQFETGTFTGTTTTNVAGGEVILGAGGRSDWCAPELTIATLDLPKNGVANDLTAIEGMAFAGTGDNASGVSFAKVVISNDNPPVSTLGGTFDGYKTNAVFGEAGYAYLATDNNTEEIVIINTQSQPYTKAGSVNAPGSENANSLYVQGSVGYMTQSNKLYTFDLSSKSGARPILGNIELPGSVEDVVVSGGYAYVALSGTSTELRIIDVANPSNPVSVGQADVDGTNGKDVFINSSATRAYLVTQTSDSNKAFFVIDISTKTGNRPTIGSYNTNGMDGRGVVVVPGNRAIVVGHGGEEYQVINISDETNPVRCGGLNVDTGINGVATVVEQDGDAYSYIITGDATSEFKIIAGGPGGESTVDGTYESAAFDAQNTTAFNRFYATATTPNQTQVRFQIAIADAVAGACDLASFAFVGPDGTDSTFFTSAGGAIPMSDDNSGFENPGQCMKYRAYLSTTDTAATPTLFDASVNYSP